MLVNGLQSFVFTAAMAARYRIEKALSLLFLGKVQKELDDPCAIAMEMLLQVDDGTISLLPDRLIVDQPIREPLASENLRMRADNQHLLVVGSVEDTDPAAFRQALGRAPEEIVL